ncbi:MAG TPA: hypothetical protein VFH58_02700 [Acidimicrobiales bacterium]|nr:hypothetical protein [Acidimicrobiales bacterium]
MGEAPITSTFVSQVVPLGFADAADSADRLTGSEIAAGRARLQFKQRIGDGLAGAVWYEGVLRTGHRLLPSVHVDIVVSPWSAGRTEIGLRPLSRIGRPESLRAGRFFDAAWAVLPRLLEQLALGRPAETPVTTGLVAA